MKVVLTIWNGLENQDLLFKSETSCRNYLKKCDARPKSPKSYVYEKDGIVLKSFYFFGPDYHTEYTMRTEL